MLEGIPDSWGPKLALDRAAVTSTCTGPNAIHMKASAHYALVLLSTQRIRHVALNSDRPVVGAAPVGSIELVPMGSDLFAKWESPKENILAGLSAERLKMLAGAEFGKDDFELYPPRLGTVDIKALTIGRFIREELRASEYVAHECVEAWLTIFGFHILRRYSSLGVKAISIPRTGLAPRIWRNIEEFIRANLSRRITIETLAEAARLSPSHFTRSFREMTGQSPYQYILAMRLETARSMIIEGKDSFEKVAQLSGFSSNSHMTATMQRVWGVNPTAIRHGKSRLFEVQKGAL